MVASFAKDNELAKIVGSKTSGEVIGGANFGLPKVHCLRIPVVGGGITWSGHCIGGARVEPDVVVENMPKSLAAGTDVQLQKAFESVSRL